MPKRFYYTFGYSGAAEPPGVRIRCTRKIGDRAFSNGQQLEAVYIPDSVTEFGSNVFKNCPRVVLICESDNAGAAYARRNGLTYICMNGQ